MATRSMIGKLNEDKSTVTAIYCHWDGYLEHNGRILNEYYTNSDRVDQLLALGDLSVLGKDIGEKHDLEYNVKGVCTAYGRDMNGDGVEASTYSLKEYTYSNVGEQRGVDFVYLFDGKEWLYQTYGYGWRSVSQKLESIKKSAQ